MEPDARAALHLEHSTLMLCVEHCALTIRCQLQLDWAYIDGQAVEAEHLPGRHEERECAAC
eukprot:5105101-Prymnesium_polylepis.1